VGGDDRGRTSNLSSEVIHGNVHGGRNPQMAPKTLSRSTLLPLQELLVGVIGAKMRIFSLVFVG